MTARAVDLDRFRRIFRHHAGGVVVITFDPGSGPVGFTATSLTSVSATPPLVSFAIGHTTSSWPFLENARSVVANFLRHDQHDIATRFSTSGIDRFAPPLQWDRLTGGDPYLCAARQWIRCEIRRRMPVGDHHLLVAEIVDIGDNDPSSSALVYHGGGYHPVGHA